MIYTGAGEIVTVVTKLLFSRLVGRPWVYFRRSTIHDAGHPHREAQISGSGVERDNLQQYPTPCSYSQCSLMFAAHNHVDIGPPSRGEIRRSQQL